MYLVSDYKPKMPRCLRFILKYYYQTYCFMEYHLSDISQIQMHGIKAIYSRGHKAVDYFKGGHHLYAIQWTCATINKYLNHFL